VEYNNYIYQSEVTTTFHEVQPPGYQNESNSFLGLIPSLISGLIPGGGAILPFMNVPIVGNLLSVLSNNTPTDSSRGEFEEVVAYKNQLALLEAERVEINHMLSEINKRTRAANLLIGKLDFVNKISVNPNIKPSIIKEMLLDYYSNALMLEDGKTFTIKDISILNSKLGEIPQLKSDVSIRIAQYNIKKADLKKLHNKLKSTDHGIEALYPLMKQYEQQELSISDEVNSLESKVDSLSIHQVSDYQSSIQEVYLKYLELINNNFTLETNTEANSKFILYEVKIYLRDSSAGFNLDPDSKTHLYKALKIKINTYGGFGLITSIGIQGSTFKNKIQSYYINSDGVIGAEDKDKFIPFVSSLFNLSYQLSSSFTPALSIGIGIPLSNKDVLDNLAFIIGPSVIVGKSKNLILTGGIIFSKVQRLSRNLQIGDIINVGIGEIPTAGKFDYGYTFGISYNIGNR
ncbi:MAG: hypothetical protein ABIO44_12300, partial [Saprospiraceae bacterium]